MTHNANRDSNLIATLQLVGLRATFPRYEILRVFSHGCKPLNADFVCEKVASRKISQATVYRTLTSLAVAGVLKRVDLRKGSAFYELKDSGIFASARQLRNGPGNDGHKHKTDHRYKRHDHHHHIVCTDCGKTESFKNCDIEKVSEKILRKSPSFKAINEHSLELFGMCKMCAK